MKYDENGTLSEKQLYRWNSSQSKWEASIIYQYEYNRSNQLAELQYSKWDNKNSSWYNTKHTLFSDQLNEKLIAISYLDTLK